MTEREKAIKRLREASQRLTEAHDKLDSAQAELISAALALDQIENQNRINS